MNPQERDQLSRFLTQLEHASVPEKVPEADALIRQTLTRQPDAAYLLVQRSMLLEQALNAAKAHIAALQRQQQESLETSKGGFLNANPWTQSQELPQIPRAVPGSGNYQIPRNAPVTGAAQSTGPSFLGNIASTAAGVVAGSFLFQGLESLLGHHAPFGGSGTHTFEDQPVEQTINNYYGSDTDSDSSEADAPDSFLSSDDSFGSDTGDDSSWV